MNILLSPRAWVAAIIIGLLVALLSTRGTLHDVKRERDISNASLAVSNASIKTLETEINKILLEQQELSHSDAQRIKASREMLAIAEAASKARQAVIARLQQSAAATEAQPAHEATCTFSDAVNAAWPGE